MSATTPDNANSWRGRLVAALLAFLIWGAWALFANWHNDTSHALMAGLLQGTFSGILTLLMAMAVTTLFRRLPDNPLRVLLPALSPLPTAETLKSRAAKLAHVEALQKRPNYLQSLLDAGLMQPPGPTARQVWSCWL